MKRVELTLRLDTTATVKMYDDRGTSVVRTEDVVSGSSPGPIAFGASIDIPVNVMSNENVGRFIVKLSAYVEKVAEGLLKELMEGRHEAFMNSVGEAAAIAAYPVRQALKPGERSFVGQMQLPEPTLVNKKIERGD